MDKFFTVENKDKFPRVLYTKNLITLREDISEFLLEGDEKTFFDLDEFAKKHKNKKTIMQMVDTVIEELHALGWKTFLGFGGTGLYIYSSEEKPPNAY